MRIIELYVENFGKLSQYRQSFSPALNSFCMENGAGKTTLTVFIKAMLYGLDASHKQSLSENERKKYTPWQGGAFGGWMSFESNGARYRIERSFSQKASDDTFTLYNLDTGAVSTDFSASLGEELFGIDADGFERTVFHSEKNLPEKNENHTIAAKLSDLVGVEGDIGDFDDAISLLEKRRMFYQKRGGAGEIQSTNNEISEIEMKIADADKEALQLAKYEKEYTELAERSRALRDQKHALLGKRREDEEKKRRIALVDQYRSMLLSLKADEEREGELLEFFKKKIPTAGEIREASEQLNEADRLVRAANAVSDDEEYERLAEFFKNPTDSSECEKMIRIAETVTAMDTTVAESDCSAPVCPFAKVPTEEEISEYSELSAKKKAKKSGNGAGLTLTVMGILLIIGGIALGIAITSVLFAVAGVGVILTLVGLLLGRKKASEDTTVRDFIRSVYGNAREDVGELSALIEMRAALERYKAARSDYDRRRAVRDETEAKKIKAENILENFLIKFDTPPYSPVEKVRYIAEKHRRFTILSEQKTKSASESKEALRRAALLREGANEFLRLFDTKGPLPLDEIRNNLAEHEALHASLTRRRADAERFALSNGINAELLSEAMARESSAEFNTDGNIATLDSELLSLEGSLSSLKSSIAALSREIETRPVLEEKRLELIERRERYEQNLSVIKKAKELLGKAKTNLTARYLDSTCKGFEKYVSFIDEAKSEFSMDTTFSVKKDDMGAARESAWYSRGTKDLYALAVRLSLSDALYEGELPPLILDDPFSAFDDAHTENALSLVKKLSSERQILYFTCSKSRKVK